MRYAKKPRHSERQQRRDPAAGRSRLAEESPRSSLLLMVQLGRGGLRRDKRQRHEQDVPEIRSRVEETVDHGDETSPTIMTTRNTHSAARPRSSGVPMCRWSSVASAE